MLWQYIYLTSTHPVYLELILILLAIYFYDRKLVWLDGYPIGWLLFPFLEGGYER